MIKLSSAQSEELYAFLALSMHVPWGERMSLTLPHPNLDLFVGGFRWSEDEAWMAPVFVASTGEPAGRVRATAGDLMDDPPYFFLPDRSGEYVTILRDKNARWRLWNASIYYAQIVTGGRPDA